MSQFNRFRLLDKVTKNLACCMIAASSFFVSSAIATEPVLRGRTHAQVSEVGACEVRISIRTQLNYYSALKRLGGNFSLLARTVGMDDRNWNMQSALTGQFIDTNNEVELEYHTPGAARNVKGDHWVFPLPGGEQFQLVAATASHITLMTAETTDIGLGTMVIDIDLPATATNAAFDGTKQEISYDFIPQVTSGSNPELQFDVDHKSTLISSLAKNYSNPKFTYMWAARAVAKNTGDQILSNYRVRFRVAEMGSWGSWQRAAKLYPGQTVVDPFFPIFDLEKMMSLNGSRPAVIEVEYEYQQADGSKVQESDSFPVQILSRNEAIFSSLKPTEITGFHDQFDYAPALLTSMTTPADPVVQQLAGRINGMAAATYGQSIAATQTDSECIAFMSAVFHFLQSNQIAYQSPPGMLTDGNQGQHIKYTRDVLRNRAGTCVDLAITWASVCEAVGLETAIVLIPGHAFPAVKLPETQQWFALESTMLNGTFQDAVKSGNSRLAEAMKADHYLIDVSATRNEGVLGLDLPNVSEEYLSNLGYSFVAQHRDAATGSEKTGDTNTNPQQERTPDANVAPDNYDSQTSASSLHGTWGGYGISHGMNTWVGMALNSDGTLEVLLQYFKADGSNINETINGSWKLENGVLTLTNGDAKNFEYPIEFTGDQLKLCILGGTQVVTLERKSQV